MSCIPKSLIENLSDKPPTKTTLPKPKCREDYEKDPTQRYQTQLKEAIFYLAPSVTTLDHFSCLLLLAPTLSLPQDPHDLCDITHLGTFSSPHRAPTERQHRHTQTTQEQCPWLLQIPLLFISRMECNCPCVAHIELARGKGKRHKGGSRNLFCASLHCSPSLSLSPSCFYGVPYPWPTWLTIHDTYALETSLDTSLLFIVAYLLDHSLCPPLTFVCKGV